MLRAIASFTALLGLLSLAPASNAADVVGTIVSTDPSAQTVVVKTADGRDVVYRTVETTRIQQGGATVDLGSLPPGSRVQITSTATPPPPAGSTTIVYPVASGIVVAPTAAPKPSVAAPKADDDDVDVDIDTDTDDDDDDDD
jgi:hypothetical protein